MSWSKLPARAYSKCARFIERHMHPLEAAVARADGYDFTTHPQDQRFLVEPVRAGQTVGDGATA
jgi:hypothetical protein